MDISQFQESIDCNFSDISLLEEALTHPSVNSSKFGKKIYNYQRLEFFGDKVLGLIIGEYLMNNFADDNEGDLSKRYAAIVSCESLAGIALDIGIDKVIKLSHGEQVSGGALKKSNLENCLEALIGAVYFDLGFEKCQEFVLNIFESKLKDIVDLPFDPVSTLQEIVQEKVKSLPDVKITRVSGVDHDPIFEAHIIVEEMGIDVKAQGNSKKEANKNACIEALAFLSSY